MRNITIGSVLVCFFVIYILVINIVNTSDLDSDEARHVGQALTLKAYFERIFDKGSISYREFIDEEFTKKYPQAGFYGLYDPPLHAILLNIFFLAVPEGLASARLASQMIIVLCSGLLFAFCKGVLNDPKKAWGAWALVFFLPIVFVLSRQVMLAVPASILTAGWYYFTFLRNQEKTPKEVLIRILLGGACFVAASFMMYQTVVYVASFMIAYTAIDLFTQRKQFFRGFGASTTFILLLQAIICAGLMLWWLSISFSGTTISDLLVKAGTEEIKGGSPGTFDYWFSLIGQLFVDTLFFAFIALFSLRNAHFTKKHWPLFLFIMMTLLSATLLLSNRQFRYVIHLIPFVAVLIVVGFEEITRIIRRSHRVFWLLLVLGIAVLCTYDLIQSYNYAKEQGVYTTVYDYLADQPLPRTLVGIDIKGERPEFAYMHTSDTFLANAMMIDQQGQSATYFDASEFQTIVVDIDQINDANMYVLVFEPMLNTELGKKTHQFFIDNQFSVSKIEPYAVYHHTVKSPKSTQFTSIAGTKEAKKYVDEANKYLKSRDYKKTAELLQKALNVYPLHLPLRKSLAIAFSEQALEEIRKGDAKQAEFYLGKSMRTYPWVLDELKEKEYDPLRDLAKKLE